MPAGSPRTSSRGRRGHGAAGRGGGSPSAGLPHPRPRDPPPAPPAPPAARGAAAGTWGRCLGTGQGEEERRGEERSGSARSSGAGAGSPAAAPAPQERPDVTAGPGRSRLGCKPGAGFPPAASARPRGPARLGSAPSGRGEGGTAGVKSPEATKRGGGREEDARGGAVGWMGGRSPSGRGKQRGVTVDGREQSHAGDNGSGRGALCRQVLAKHLGFTRRWAKKKVLTASA